MWNLSKFKLLQMLSCFGRRRPSLCEVQWTDMEKKWKIIIIFNVIACGDHIVDCVLLLLQVMVATKRISRLMGVHWWNTKWSCCRWIFPTRYSAALVKSRPRSRSVTLPATMCRTRQQHRHASGSIVTLTGISPPRLSTRQTQPVTFRYRKQPSKPTQVHHGW